VQRFFHWPKLPDEPNGLLFNGLAALALSIIMWRLTGSWLGYFILALPGGALVILGWVVIFKKFHG
jgi:hypothetical protein